MIQREKTSQMWKLKAALMLLFQIFIALMFTMSAFAAGDTDIGTGYDVDVGAGSRDWGINYWTSGYRMYMEGPGGQLVQSVVDICFSDPHQYNYFKCGYTTNIGGGSRSHVVNYPDIEGSIPGLKPPYYDYAAWGPELDAWFESAVNHQNGDYSNAALTITTVFGGVAGDDWEDLLYNYNNGNYRIVVEAVYWWRLVRWDGRTVSKGGVPTWFYGNIQQMASFDALYENRYTLSEKGLPGGGPNIGNYINGTLALAICLDDTDKGFSGWNAPQQNGMNTSGEGGQFTYSQIQQPLQGYGMHIIYREKAEEKWYTYKSPSGATGGPEAASPEMPDIPGVQTGGKFRPVTIIKYYEERTVQQDGKTKSDWKTVSGPYSRPQVCRSIVIQNEPGWTVKGWFTQSSSSKPELWKNLQSIRVRAPQKGTQATEPNPITVGQTSIDKVTGEIKINEGVKTLYVWLVREKTDDTPKNTNPDGVEMVLHQSEISKAYVTTDIKDNTTTGQNKPEFKFNWTSPDKFSGFCHTDQHEEPDGTEKNEDGSTKTKEVTDNINHTWEWEDKDLNLFISLNKDKFDSYKKILGTVDPFKPVEDDTTSDKFHKEISDVGDTTEATLNEFQAKFVIWRGEDQPTITQYKASPGDSGAVDSLLDQTSASTKDQGKRKHSQEVDPDERYYDTNLSLYFKVDEDKGEYSIATRCKTIDDPEHQTWPDHSSTVNVADLNRDKEYEFKGPVKVEYFDSEEQDIVDRTGAAGDGATVRRPKYEPMTFYPYVQMSYQTIADAKKGQGVTAGKYDGTGGIVYVLSSYERGYNAQAALKIQYSRQTYPGTDYSMLVKSDQWSTHATAISKYGKNILLPGGAIFQVTSNSGSGSGKLGITFTIEAWYPDIDPAFEAGITSKDPAWNGSNGEAEFKGIVKGFKDTLENNQRLEMRVVKGQKDDASGGTPITAGTSLAAIGSNSLKASSDKKYYIKSDVATAADSRRAQVSGGGGLANVMMVEATPEGKVQAGDVTIEKNQGGNAMSSGTNAYKYNMKTKAISNFVTCLQRNQGDDTETTFGKYWATEDGAWYNEQFGMKINYYKATITVVVPQNDGVGAGGVQAVLDPNLCAVHTGTSDKFDSVNTAQFYMVCNNTSTGAKFGDQTVMIPIADLMKSQPFYIAAYTVQDND